MSEIKKEIYKKVKEIVENLELGDMIILKIYI